MSLANGILGEIWIFIGGRKRGKTTQMIKLAQHVPNERLFYNEFHGNSWNEARKLKRKYVDPETFLDFTLKVHDCMIVWEDASAIFKSNVSRKAIEMLARSRNEGVTIFLAFHSFRKVPNDILDMIDGVWIFGTEDKVENIMHKTDNPEVLRAFNEIRASGNFWDKKKIRFIPKHQPK